MKKDWMAQLAAHYQKTRHEYPDDALMILFDIDGTILDMRHLILHTLHAYDREHNTRYFRHLRLDDVDVHENQIAPLLARLQIDPATQQDITSWYMQERWRSEAIVEAHRPFEGVMNVIRWFQLQPNVAVGLNTGRPEAIRADTLRCLNRLGQAYRVHFGEEDLHMNAADWEEGVLDAKIAGVRSFQQQGYRIFAVVDNEPEVLKSIADIDPQGEILLLHANTLFESKRVHLPRRAARGNTYHLTELIPEKLLPPRVQFVWHGVNDRANLRQFLASNIRWAECDVHLDPTGSELILRHDSFTKTPLAADEEWLGLEEALETLRAHNRAVKLDLKAGGVLVDKILELVDRYGFAEEDLWFNGNVERLQEHRLRQLAADHPGAILQVPVDFLFPLVQSAPQKAREILDMFASWGVNRFSISWLTEDMRAFFDQMDRWGFEVNIYNVPDLESFLQAVLLMPRSVTADFNFPQWHYYGRGSGERGNHFEYALRRRRHKK
ncbi:MAG: hypothetical protein D6796_04315 [Caldilineae bacterium]|nr:MAG: hypothetical protein D6796_04315 [Caldilineae bacterium]